MKLKDVANNFPASNGPFITGMKLISDRAKEAQDDLRELSDKQN